MIREMGQRLKNYDPIGFYTQEIGVNGHRHGFPLVSLDGPYGIVYHIQHRGLGWVGRYGVDITGFGRFLTELDLCPSTFMRSIYRIQNYLRK